MKIFMSISLLLALIFLFFSISSAHITFSQSQEHQASSESQEQQSSSQNHESHASSQSQEHYASSQSQVGSGSSQSLEHDTSSQSRGHDASSQSQGRSDASSQSQGRSDASSQSQGHSDASSQSQGNIDASSQSQRYSDASSLSTSNKSQGHDASSQRQGRDTSNKSQGRDASSQSQGRDSSSKKERDASNRSQGHDSSNQSQGRDSYRRRQGHDAKSHGNDASSQSQGPDTSSHSQGNDGSNQSHGHNAKSQGHDVSSQSQGLHASFDFHGSYKGCFSKVYAFGGSDTDTGNANLLGGLLNATFGKSKGRLGDGRLVVDFLCDALSVPEISAYKEVNVNSTQASVNFAVAGSTALPGDFFNTHNLSSLIWKDSPKTFQTQIEWFNKFLIDMGCKGPNRGGSCKADIGNSLFWIGEMGVTDFMSAIGSSIPLPHVTEISVRIVCELLKVMLDNGAKYVVVQGLPPLGCLPTYMSSSSEKEDRDHMGCVASANIGIINYNQILQERLQKFRKLYPHCSILYADYWNAYLTILTNPKKYQIEEPFKACCEQKPQGLFTINRHSLFGSQRSTTCKDPTKYISWDGIHLTEAMNKKLTALFLNEGFCKPSFSELVKAKLKM